MGCWVSDGGNWHISKLNSVINKVFPFGAPGRGYSVSGDPSQEGGCWRGSIYLQNLSRRECLKKNNQAKREERGEEDPFLFWIPVETGH